MKTFLYLLCTSLLFASCSSTNLVFISVKEPAPVTLPNYVNSVTVVNRCINSNENKTLNKIHEVISLETENLLREGSKACVSGLADELNTNNRFVNIVKLDSTELRSPGTGIFPAPLAWEQVEKICQENHTDALFALELFDTESKLNYSASPSNINTPLGSVPALEHHVNMTTLVKTGWRMYDPASKTILDESYITKDLQFSGKGINPVVAAQGLIGKKEAVKQVSNIAGQMYATKIDPYWIRVHREYFVRGDDAFFVAKRKAQTGNWNEAADIWLKETESPSRKVAGRACYNMAIISEINGDVNSAIIWAQKAYENYRIRLGLEYVDILRHRKADEEMLTIQKPR